MAKLKPGTVYSCTTAAAAFGRACTVKVSSFKLCNNGCSEPAENCCRLNPGAELSQHVEHKYCVGCFSSSCCSPHAVIKTCNCNLCCCCCYMSTMHCGFDQAAEVTTTALVVSSCSWRLLTTLVLIRRHFFFIDRLRISGA
jgi:hypothetical protein